MSAGLRLMFFDRTCGGWGPAPGLSFIWRLGGRLYGALGRIDAWRGVATWDEALDFLLNASINTPISEIQFWGHGRWGRVLVNGRQLDVTALRPGHSLHPKLLELRSRLSGPEALFWFRTCETFGTRRGHDFAKAWTRFFGCRAAGHTFIIGPFQSGLHLLGPGEEPDWSITEGIDTRASVTSEPKALPSQPLALNTVSFLHGRIPERMRSESLRRPT